MANAGRLLGDILQKLTDALVQTQEFQQVAENLEQWVSSMQATLKQQEPVAARVRLIEPQMEGLKASALYNCRDGCVNMSQFFVFMHLSFSLLSMFSILHLSSLHTLILSSFTLFSILHLILSVSLDLTSFPLFSIIHLHLSASLNLASFSLFLQPVLDDIKLSSATLEQVSSLGQQLISQANPEERLKVDKRLHALEMRFYGLDKASKTRMSDLEVIRYDL